MEPLTIFRLVFVYAHLLLCVFALQLVLSTDFRVLREQLSERTLTAVHQRIVQLLAGLWLTGLLVAAIDLGFDPSQIVRFPKTIAKLCAVGLLTANGIVLRYWCFPRMMGGHAPGTAEFLAVMACGAISTASWLMAAFFGIARPLQRWPVASILELFVGALALAVLAALLLGLVLRQGDAKRRADHTLVT